MAAAARIGLSWPSRLTAATTTSSTERPRWMTSPSPRSTTTRSGKTMKIEALLSSLDAETKTFTLQKPENAFNEAKDNFKSSTGRKANRGLRMTQWRVHCGMGFPISPIAEISPSAATRLGYGHGVAEILTGCTTETLNSASTATKLGYGHGVAEILPGCMTEASSSASALVQNLVLIDLDPATAKTLIPFLGPFLSGFAFLFILRIVMSWYPKLPVEKFPYIIAYAPTEPLLIPTRKFIPPLAGVDVTPVVWFGLVSFLNEILVGPQGLLVLLSQKI